MPVAQSRESAAKLERGLEVVYESSKAHPPGDPGFRAIPRRHHAGWRTSGLERLFLDSHGMAYHFWESLRMVNCAGDF